MPLVDTNGIATYYEEQGSGEPLLFIHGAFGDSQMWQQQVDHFSQHYRVITYDVRGHGETGHSPRRHYSIALLADDLDALCQQLNISIAAVCGLSMGGLIAQQFAVSYPHRVNRLALCATLAASQINPERPSLQERLMQRCIESASKTWLNPQQCIAWMRLMMSSSEKAGQRSARKIATRRYLEQQIRKMPAEEFGKLLRAFFGFKLLPLEQIGVPTLVMVGEHEFSPFHRHSRLLQRRIPQARTTVVPEVGHIINQEAPSLFNQHLGHFLVTG